MFPEETIMTEPQVDTQVERTIDAVEAAVKAHPAGLTELSVICSSGQPCARVYQSERWDAAGQAGR